MRLPAMLTIFFFDFFVADHVFKNIPHTSSPRINFITEHPSGLYLSFQIITANKNSGLTVVKRSVVGLFKSTICITFRHLF